MLKVPRMIFAVLTDESRKLLEKNIIPKFSNTTLKTDQYMHHVTLAYNPIYSFFIKINEKVSDGTQVIIKTKGLCWSDSLGVEALSCITFRKSDFFSIPCQNDFQHITISTEGLPPSKSNEVIKQFDFQSKELTLDLDGIIKYYY